ncbi:MAG: proton-conducting transporter membrane subunit, partial [Elusimicrobiota bacterium]
MITDTALLFAILTPVLGAFILPLVGRYSAAARNWLALVLIGIPLVFSLMCIPSVYSGEVLSFMYSLPLGFNLTFVADPLAIFMAIVSSLISFVIMIYSFDYISHYDNQNEYYFMVVLFLGSMIGLIFAANLILLYIFWELTGITSWRLIGFYRGKSDIYRANKSFLVTVFGALVMLLGFIIVYQQTGSFDYNSVCDTGKNYMISNLAVLLILFGILSKSATLPFHTWLPDAGVAPSPVTALLHAAVLVKIGVYVYARLFLATYSIDEIWTTAVPLIAGFSALVAAGAAFVETDLKRIIAYSTISQIGFIFLGL